MERSLNGFVPATEDFSSPEFCSERKMVSPDFGRRPEHDPFGDNYHHESDKDDDDDDMESGVSTPSSKVCLKREVGFTGCLSLVVGVMIGSGIFSSPSVVFKESGSAGMSLVSWCVCGVICILAALCYAELGTSIHSSGGERTYLSLAFGEVAGFLYSWTAILIIKPAAISGVCMSFANYVLEPFFPGCQSDHIYLMKMVASIGIGKIYFLSFNFVIIVLIMRQKINTYTLFRAGNDVRWCNTHARTHAYAYAHNIRTKHTHTRIRTQHTRTQAHAHTHAQNIHTCARTH